MSLINLVDAILPLKSKIKQAEQDFNFTVYSFFVIYRFLNGLSILNTISYLFLFYQQILGNSDKIGFTASIKALDTNLCHDKSPIVPCFMLYSRFDYSLAVNFSLNLVMFIIIGQIAMIYRFNIYDRENRNKEVFEGSQYSISSKIFGDWDWSFKSLN